MTNKNSILSILNKSMTNIKKFHVSQIALFGSFARGDQSDSSDVDILVEFDDGQETFDNYMDLKFYLQELFNREVDLVLLNSIKPTIKPEIMGSAIYAKGTQYIF